MGFDLLVGNPVLFLRFGENFARQRNVFSILKAAEQRLALALHEGVQKRTMLAAGKAVDCFEELSRRHGKMIA